MKVLYYILLFLSISVVYVNSVSVKVLEPSKNGTFDIGIIITPGADIDGEAYEPLGLQIQKSFPGRMWIALLCDFPFNSPNPIQLPGAVDDAISIFKEKGFKGNDIFLAGHSLGGVFVGEYGKSHPSKLAGVMLFASYLTRPNKLVDYPVPLLTLSGDLDGLTRITRIVDTFEELQHDAYNDPGNISIIYSKPVIVMEGINHGRFASGKMPPNVLKHDLPVDKNVTGEYAHEVISGFVNSFVIVTTRKPDGSAHLLTAIAVLKVQGFYNTENIMRPLSVVKAMDINHKGNSRTIEIIQGYIFGNELSKHVQVNDTEVSEALIEMYTPDVKVNGDKAHVQTYTSVEMPFDPEDVSLNPQTPSELLTVMKTRAGMLALLPKIFPYGRNLTCKDVNQIIYQIAFNTSSLLARQRFIDRNSPQIQLKDDVTSGSLVEWTMRSLDLEYGENGELEVTSPSYIVAPDPDNPQDKMSGTQHCKLLSPYRALEWFYIDSLKRSSDR